MSAMVPGFLSPSNLTIVLKGMSANALLAIGFTLVLVGLFWNGAGALMLSVQAPVRWDWLPALLAGSLIGGYVGAHWALLKGNRLVKRAFEILTVVAGSKLLWDALVRGLT